MTVDELKALSKKFPNGRAKSFLIKVDGERYPEREMKIDMLEFMVGINGEVVFK